MLRNPGSGGYGTMGFMRSFLGFDTSSIPDSAVITGATLHIYPKTVRDPFDDGYDWINVYQGSQASTTVLANSDISHCGDATTSPTKGSSDKGLTGLSTNAYSTFTINSTGLGWISKTSPTKLCLREGHDAENYEITGEWGDWNNSGVIYAASEAAGTSTDPYLTVEYTY